MILYCDLIGSSGDFVARLTAQNVAYTGHFVDILFDSLIVRYASHKWGKRFFLRFSLYDPAYPNGTCHDFVQSALFETITKRGEYKRQQRTKMKQQLVKSVQYVIHENVVQRFNAQHAIQQKQIQFPSPTNTLPIVPNSTFATQYPTRVVYKL